MLAAVITHVHKCVSVTPEVLRVCSPEVIINNRRDRERDIVDVTDNMAKLKSNGSNRSKALSERRPSASERIIHDEEFGEEDVELVDSEWADFERFFRLVVPELFKFSCSCCCAFLKLGIDNYISTHVELE